jgi:hypothetical protein
MRFRRGGKDKGLSRRLGEGKDRDLRVRGYEV